MTPTDLSELKAAAEAATEGPWFVHDFADPAVAPDPTAADVTVSCDHPATIIVASMGGGLFGYKGLEQARKDAAFIALANPTVVLSLIAAAEERERLEGENISLSYWRGYWEETAALVKVQESSRDAELTTLRAELAALREAAGAEDALVVDAQDILTKYLIPDGLTADGAIGRLLELFDGPRQRKVQRALRAELEKKGGRE